MVSLRTRILTFIKDERGGEVLEYAIIACLIVVAAIGVTSSVATKTVAHWSSLNASYGGINNRK